MKIKYTCEHCKTTFDTEEEALACEKKHEADKQKKQEKMDAAATISAMVNSYVEKYGTMPTIQVDSTKLFKNENKFLNYFRF